MKTLSTTAIVALLTASIGLGAIAPALAQDAASTPPSQNQAADAERGFRFGGDGPRRGGFSGDLLGVERSAEAVEIAIVRLSHRLDLTADQAGLLDTLKTTAMTAAEDFAAATETLRPASASAERPDLSTRLETRIALEKARLDALESVQPALAAFFDSLTDEQKATLTPERGERPATGQRDHRPGHQHGGKR